MYSLGLFVDPDAAKKALMSYSKKPADKLKKDQGFYEGKLVGARTYRIPSPLAPAH